MPATSLMLWGSCRNSRLPVRLREAGWRLEEKAVILPEKTKADSLEEMVLPFDIGLQLSESELEAKRNVKLPYMAAQTQE
uniref:Uncharacterized protein n=1 Tax=Parascaris equorum TaxID=6256 RepID=A0A914RM64_PAREQ